MNFLSLDEAKTTRTLPRNGILSPALHVRSNKRFDNVETTNLENLHETERRWRRIDSFWRTILKERNGIGTHRSGSLFARYPRVRTMKADYRTRHGRQHRVSYMRTDFMGNATNLAFVLPPETLSLLCDMLERKSATRTQNTGAGK